MLLVDYLRKVVDPHGTGGLTDGQLLDRYVASRDEAAFELLVWRHGAMVLAVCRRVLGRFHDAEDAFQATFLALAQSARSISRREAVGGWLHRVAHRTALRARTKASRGAVPLDADWPDGGPADDNEWRELRPVLDDEVNRLPVKYRTPFVLCCLEGRTNQEAARQLGCPKGTILSRLSRARAILRARLTRRGVTLTWAALGAALAPQAWADAPAPLIRATVQGAMLVTTGNAIAAGVISPHVVALTQGVLLTMFISKFVKIAAVVLLAIGLIGGAGLLANAALADKPAQSKSNDNQSTSKSPDKPKSDSPDKGKKEQGPTVHGTVEIADADKSTITVNVIVPSKEKRSEQKTFAVEKDVKVVLEETFDKSQSPPAGKLADVTPGTQVTLQLSADGKAVVRIGARGPGIYGHIKAASTADRTLTVGTKQKGGPQDVTVTLADRAKILLSDGLSKQDPPVEGKLSDLAEGTPVQIQLSVDRKRALGVHVQGVTLHGYLKSYDTVNNTLIISVKGENGEEDRTLTAVKNAQLIDLLPGAPVTVRLSVFEKDKVAYAHGEKGK